MPTPKSDRMDSDNQFPEAAKGCPPVLMPQTSHSSARLKLRRFAVQLLIGNLVIIGLLCMVGWLVLKTSRQTDEAAAAETVQNMAASLAAEIASEMKLIDNALATAASAYRAGLRDPGGAPAIETVLRQQKALLPQVDAIRIAGADGMVRVGLTPGAQPVSIGDRDYFRAAREQSGMVVSEPLQGRIIQKWGLIFARRVEHADGSFAGVVYSNLSSEYLARRFSKMKIGPSGAVALRSKELRLIARFSASEPASEKNLGTSNVSGELKDALARSGAQGWYVTSAPLDNLERVAAYHRVPGYDLTVLAGLATRDVLAPWRRDVLATAGLLVVAALAVLAASAGIYVQRRRHVLAQRRIAELVQQQELMLNNDLVGMVRLINRVAVWSNKALWQIFGYGEREFDGLPSRVLYFDDASYEGVGTEGYAALNAGGRYRTQIRMRRKDGSPVWIDLSGTLVSEHESLWMFVDISAMKGKEERLEQLAHHDPLTGLPNRGQFTDRLRQLLVEGARDSRALTAVCCLDLDGFKAVNDRFGHSAGDQVLVEVSRRLLACVRAGDMVTRFGGDEFAITLVDMQNHAQVEAILQRVLVSIREPIAIGGETALVRASIGVVYAPEHGAETNGLMQRADEAMYRAKRDGKDCIRSA
jgi:diguanylate cyclase (GGDEF)-like protein